MGERIDKGRACLTFGVPIFEKFELLAYHFKLT